MKNLVVLNVAMPLLLVAAVIAKTRHDAEFLLWSLAFAVILLGLAVTSVVALFVLWKRHGPKALAPLLTLLVVGVLTGTAATYGSRLVLSGTPASPDTFVRGATQRELERSRSVSYPVGVARTLRRLSRSTDSLPRSTP